MTCLLAIEHGAMGTLNNHINNSKGCGNILGAYIGYNAIPQKYKDSLELHDLIIEITDSLYNTRVGM